MNVKLVYRLPHQWRVRSIVIIGNAVFSHMVDYIILQKVVSNYKLGKENILRIILHGTVKLNQIFYLQLKRQCG